MQTIPPPPEPECVRVILDLIPLGGAICGSLFVSGQPGRDFHGWLELADGLERARVAEAADVPPTTDRP
jgi:hypothetical protein